MTLLAEYRDARRDEDVARIRRVIALRALIATGMSQRQIAKALGISQPAVSQQLKFSPDLMEVHPEILLVSAAPVLKALAEENVYSRLASIFHPSGDGRRRGWWSPAGVDSGIGV